jgi:hypothetical protein
LRGDAFAVKLALMFAQALAPRRAGRIVAATLLTVLFASAVSAEAAVTVTGFSATPSTTRAGGHPNLSTSIAFSEPTTLSGLALHLPAGLRAEPRAFPFCSRKSLLADFCPLNSKVGSIAVVAVAYGIELPVTREIYNVRPRSPERLRLGVPIIASYTGTGVAAEFPVSQRPQDKGLDIAVSGLPSEVGGIAVRVREVKFFLKGTSRKRIKRRVRKRAFLTNPVSCTPATTALDVMLHDATTLTATSSFTPTGCSPVG